MGERALIFTKAGEELGERELRFVERFLIHGNQTRAAIEAGYAERSASSYAVTLMRRKGIKAEITARRHLMSRQNMADAVEVRQRLSEILRFGEHRDAISAAKELALLDGLYPEKKREDDNRGVTVNVIQMNAWRNDS